MNTFDLFIFIPIALGLIFGLFKGFVKEVVSLVAVVLAVLTAELLNEKVSTIIDDWSNLSPKMTTTLSYTLIFIFTALIALLISGATHKLLRNLSLGWLNTLLGGLFGALKYAVVVSVAMNVFDALDSKFRLAKPEAKEASIGYYPILQLAPTLWQEAKKTYLDGKETPSDTTSFTSTQLRYEQICNDSIKQATALI